VTLKVGLWEWLGRMRGVGLMCGRCEGGGKARLGRLGRRFVAGGLQLRNGASLGDVVVA
jgi:hypothetical protein